MQFTKNRVIRRFLVLAGCVFLVLAVLVIFMNAYLEPALRKKLHSLIIEGSDSLYTYRLGSLKAHLLGGKIELQDLEITVDSARYLLLKEQDALPALTIDMRMNKGSVKGIEILSLLANRKVDIYEIASEDADIRLMRHFPPEEEVTIRPPLWKAMQPAIAAIFIHRVKLDGVKFLYHPADTAQSVKLQFDRFDALVENIQIDSIAANDTTRIGFARDMFLKFYDMKFRTPDSSYKMKAATVTYSSKEGTVEIDSFRLQPTLERADFYENYGVQASLYDMQFDRIRLTNAHLYRFFHSQLVEADTVFLEHPRLAVYLDKTQERKFSSKIGSYPHQRLLRSGTTVRVRHVVLQDASVQYTEKNGSTGDEGTLTIDRLRVVLRNVTNDRGWISKDPVCTAEAEGNILGNSGIRSSFRFYLDSANGRFDVAGSIRNVSAKQLNELSIPLSNTEIRSLQIHRLDFNVRASDFTAWADVRMAYNDLFIVFRKTDDETGVNTERKFMTRAMNRHVLQSHNPWNGVERSTRDLAFSRLTTTSFFGVIWKSIFAGMQKIIVKV